MQLSTTTIGTGSRTAALVHGLSASSQHWTEFARLLVDEHDCTVTLVDLPRPRRQSAGRPLPPRGLPG